MTRILMNSPENTQKLRRLLSRFVSVPAQAYCLELWQKYPFHFVVTRRRISKLGDYRYQSTSKAHQISVNGSLNPHAFLLTYIHEVAHLLAFTRHGFRIAPHGKEWKGCFQELMAPVLNSHVFPEDVLLPLQNYMRNPKAASGSDQQLTLALQQYDRQDGLQSLTEIAVGQHFRFRQAVFIKEEVRRTRALCKEMKSGRRYLVSLAARVELVIK
ncbi:MAG: SprT-like domain-containing protein [Cyclobacteriaceae bacterium]